MKNRMKTIAETFARQAGFDRQERLDFDGELEQFTQLIVKECINACGSDFGTELIKKHFGVAE
jgi:hypothetical protein